MKLSTKFFCIAYAMVLFAAGAGGIFLMVHISNTMWKTQSEQVHAAGSYAATAFLSFTDVLPGDLTPARLAEIQRQIANTIDKSVDRVEIQTTQTANREYTSLKNNEGFSTFREMDSRLMRQSVCRLDVHDHPYYIVVYADFTHIREDILSLWGTYAAVVLVLAIISGAILYITTVKITRPLNRLTQVANSITAGHYGETAAIKSSDWEIIRLTECFNLMSAAVKENMDGIQEQFEK